MQPWFNGKSTEKDRKRQIILVRASGDICSGVWQSLVLSTVNEMRFF